MDKKLEYKILNLAGTIGEILLENGSEISRVESTIDGMARHFGMTSQSFATLTCIIITFENSEGEILSLVRRVRNRTTNLDKVHKVYNLIEKLDGDNLTSIYKEIKEIKNEKPYSLPMVIFANILVAVFFVVLFKGRVEDIVVSIIGAILLGFFNKISDFLNLGTFFSNLISGFIISYNSFLFRKIGYLESPDISIISVLMLLVPGVSFINSMRDIFSGDLVTGVSRILEVIMIGTAIAVGTGVAFMLVGGLR